MILLLQIFLIKLLDTIISTIKSICLHKGYYFISAILGGIVQFIFFFIMRNVLTDKSMTSAIVVSIATTLGMLIAPKIISKFEKDKVYKMVITATNFNSGKKLAKDLKKNGLPFRSEETIYNGINSLVITTYCETKVESSLVKRMIPSGFKVEVDKPKWTYTKQDED